MWANQTGGGFGGGGFEGGGFGGGGGRMGGGRRGPIRNGATKNDPGPPMTIDHFTMEPKLVKPPSIPVEAMYDALSDDEGEVTF